MALLILYFIIFLALSGVLAAVDAAVLSVTRPEIYELVNQEKWGAKQLLRIKENLPKAVVVVVIVTNSINVLGPILVSQQAFATFGPGVFAAISVALTLGTIIFSEIVPKAMGTHHAPTIGRVAAPAIQVMQWGLYPLVIALAWFSNLFRSGERPIGTEAQIRSLVVIGRRAGYIESDEGRLIYQAFVLNDRSAADVMTPLQEIRSVKADDTIKAAADSVRRAEFSRYPVFGTTVNDVRGIVLVRDLLEALADGRDGEPVSAVMRPILTVDADRRSDDLLLLFRDKHTHLAVVQSAKKTVGVVTLEDVLEELVGEIEDERDVQAVNVRSIGS